MMKHGLVLSIGLGAALAACGGGPPAPGSAGARPATSSGGAVIRTAGTGQAVSASANQRFTEAATAMRQHDEANQGRGDWTPATCNEVADRFQDAARQQPGEAFAEAWFNRGLVYERCGNTDAARTAFQRADQVGRAGYCRARVQLGVYQFRAGQTADALATFTRAIEGDANCVEGYTNRAMILRERNQPGDRVSAVADIRQALARDDRYIPALNQLALTYLAEAGDDPRSQRLMLAGIVCSQAAQVTQQRGADMTADVRGFLADIYNTWGLIDIRTGQIIRALAHFRQAYQLNPQMFQAWMNYGTINLSFRGYQDALEAFTHATQLQPNNYDAHIGLGIAQRGLGQHTQAQASYERARTIDNNRPDAYYNLGVLHENYMGGEIDDLRTALRWLNEFVTKAGGNTRYTDALTRARQHIRNITDAIRALEAVAQMNASGGGGGSSAPPAAGGSTAAPAQPASGGGSSAPPAAGGGQ